MASSETATLLGRPGFARYFATVAAARATGTMFNVAGVLLILQRTHDLALAGIVVAAATLPGAIPGPSLGGWLDVTSNRRRLVVLRRALPAVSLTAVLLLAGHPPHWPLPLASLLAGLTTPLSAGAFSSVLPEVAGPELIGVANAFEAASFNAAFIVGPALAGLLAAAAGPATAVEVQLGLGIVIAALIAGDRTFELRPQHAEPRPERVLHAVGRGFAAIWRIGSLRRNTVVDCIYVLAWGTLYVSLPAWAVSVGAGAHASGYMWAAISAGSMISGLALRHLGAVLAPRVVIVGYLLAMAALAAVWPLVAGLAAALSLSFATRIFDGPVLVGLITVRQRLAPAHLRAQIFTTVTSMHAAVVAAGAAGAGLFQKALGTDATLLAFAALLALAGAVSLLTESDGTRAASAEREQASAAARI